MSNNYPEETVDRSAETFRNHCDSKYGRNPEFLVLTSQHRLLRAVLTSDIQPQECVHTASFSILCLCSKFFEDGTMFTLNIWHDGSKQFKCISECNLTEWEIEKKCYQHWVRSHPSYTGSLPHKITFAAVDEYQLLPIIHHKIPSQVPTVALPLYSQPQQYENVFLGKKSSDARLRGKGQYKTFLGWYMQEMPRSNI